ncbi:MAG: hypothetical protein HWN67_10165 [Candidatus Helarchaeota archaeon]|nr:hypothetical protein [Candidatus Helarchaeota archaeon]
METDEKKIETFELYTEKKELVKENWIVRNTTFAPEVGILSMLMLLNDIFLQPDIQSLVNQFLTKEYKNLIILCYIFKPQT